MSDQPELIEAEVQNLLEFFLCQLRAQCTKLLGKGDEFDEELKCIDRTSHGEDVFSAQASSISFVLPNDNAAFSTKNRH